MNRKRNVSYIKPEDPHFLKVLKKEAGYDDTNHKFDKLENDFVDDEESEKPQVVVVKAGDLTAEEAEMESKKIEKDKSETKADLNQRVIFKTKLKPTMLPDSKNKAKRQGNFKRKSCNQLLSFGDDEDDDE